MTDRGARRLARVLFAVVVLEVALAVSAEAAVPGSTIAPGDLAFLGAFMLFPLVGVVLAARRPENALGWIMLTIGVVAFTPGESYGMLAVERDLPGAAWAIASTTWTWVPMIGLAGIFLLLLFPDGHLPSPRWRWFAWGAAIAMAVASLGILLGPETLVDMGYPELGNPYGVSFVAPLEPLLIAAIASIPVWILGAGASLVVRFRRAGPTERLQIRWLASAALIVGVVYAVAMAASFLWDRGWETTGGWGLVLQTTTMMLFGLIPIAIGVAVLRYRLYDIDVVIRKAVVVGVLAVLFTLVYVAIVGGIGALVESRSTTTLSFVAAAVVALLFQPVLAGARRVADRLVYGKRSSPYEVLSAFSERVGGTYAAEDVLARMAHVVAEGVGAVRADVWLRGGDALHVSASWPADAPARPEARISGDALPELPGDAAFPVQDRGELLGALAVEMPANDPLDPARAELVAGLAAQAGLVLRNVRLGEDLRARYDELKAAQKRLVTAQDAERRRLERNIHDGAQQQLVALTVKLRLAEGFVAKDPTRAESMLRDLQSETRSALEDLRDLARGIYPPLLADKGLGAALEAQARKAVVPVDVQPDGVGRYAPEVEAAVYFSVLEAMQNVAKYAGASQVQVRLTQNDADLEFEVRDDGGGFDPASTGYGTGLQGMADRLSALDGAVEVRSAIGSGTRVLGRIPVSPHDAARAHEVDG